MFNKYRFLCVLCIFLLMGLYMMCMFILRLFVEILNSCMDCDEIQFKEDGSWAPMRSKKEVQEVSAASYNNGLDGKMRHKGCVSTGWGKQRKDYQDKMS